MGSTEVKRSKVLPEAKTVGEGKQRRERPVANMIDRSEAKEVDFGTGTNRSDPAPMEIFPHKKIDAKGGIAADVITGPGGAGCLENLDKLLSGLGSGKKAEHKSEMYVNRTGVSAGQSVKR